MRYIAFTPCDLLHSIARSYWAGHVSTDPTLLLPFPTGPPNSPFKAIKYGDPTAQEREPVGDDYTTLHDDDG